MKNKPFLTHTVSMLLFLFTLGLIIPANSLDISIQFGTPPPPPPPRIVYEPVYVDLHTETVLYLGNVYFGIDYPILYSYCTRYDLTPDEVIYILYLSHYCHRSPIYVIRIYKDYYHRGWVRFSRELRIPRGAPGWLRDRNAPSIAVLRATSGYYGVPYTRLYTTYKRGYKPAEIVTAVNISGKSGKPVSTILADRSKGKRWEDISRENKVPFDRIKTPPNQGKRMKFNAPMDEKESLREGTRQQENQPRSNRDQDSPSKEMEKNKRIEPEKQNKEMKTEPEKQGKSKDSDQKLKGKEKAKEKQKSKKDKELEEEEKEKGKGKNK